MQFKQLQHSLGVPQPQLFGIFLVFSMFLTNSSPKSKVQTSVLGLEVDFVFPLSEQEQQEQQQEQQQEDQEIEPPPKSKLECYTQDQVLFLECFNGLLSEIQGC